MDGGLQAAQQYRPPDAVGQRYADLFTKVE